MARRKQQPKAPAVWTEEDEMRSLDRWRFATEPSDLYDDLRARLRSAKTLSAKWAVVKAAGLLDAARYLVQRDRENRRLVGTSRGAA